MMSMHRKNPIVAAWQNFRSTEKTAVIPSTEEALTPERRGSKEEC